MIRFARIAALFGAALMIALSASCASSKASATAEAATRTDSETVHPIDHRMRFSRTNFRPSGEGEWVTEVAETPFAFDEMIYSWQIAVPENEGSRLYLQVVFEDGSESPWLYGGFWGEVPLVAERSNPRFEHGYIAMDQLLLKKKAARVQFKVVSEGEIPATVLPDLYVITTDNEPAPEIARRFQTIRPMIYYPPVILDLPLRCQVSSTGERLPDRCQSAAMATALEYYGTAVPTEDLVGMIFDPEYDYPGIWPRTLGAATQLGYEAHIDRFRSWHDVSKALAENKVILCSISMPAGGDYESPPYPKIGGHIVALNGITEDGRVIVTDSALCRRGDALRCQWLAPDFEKVWMGMKGGVGMVITPPAGVEARYFPIEDLPPFPAERPTLPPD